MEASQLLIMFRESRTNARLIALLIVLFCFLPLHHQSAARSQSPGKASATVSVSTSSRAKNSSAPALYRRNCQRCHDQDGKGTRAKTYLPEIPDFTKAAWHRERTDADLAVSIAEGKGSHMPAFSAKFARAEVHSLVAHIRDFAPPPPTPAEHSEDDFDRRFQALKKELDDLRRQVRQLSQDIHER